MFRSIPPDGWPLGRRPSRTPPSCWSPRAADGGELADADAQQVDAVRREGPDVGLDREVTDEASGRPLVAHLVTLAYEQPGRG